MQKNNQNTQWNVKTLVYMALLVAINLVLTRVLVIDLTFYRLTFGPIATILAGLWLGPVAGGVCGLTADLLGCLMKGYAPNPLITLAAILWGLFPGIARRWMVEKSRVQKTIIIGISILLAAILGTLIFTTMGLVIYYGSDWRVLLPGRLVQCATMSPIYCIITAMLYFSPLTNMVVASMASGSFRKKTV